MPQCLREQHHRSGFFAFFAFEPGDVCGVSFYALFAVVHHLSSLKYLLSIDINLNLFTNCEFCYD
jgi:hypothetical protein